MAEHLQILRSYELRLLRCSLSPNQTPQISTISNPLQTSIETLIQSIQLGQYSKTLTSSDSTAPLLNLNNSSSSHSVSLTNSFNSFLISENNDNKPFRLLIVLAAAVSAFLAFVQCNVTGPPVTLPALFSNTDKDDLEIWARNEVMAAGSDLLGKFNNLEYLVFAKVLLFHIRDYHLKNKENNLIFSTISLWLARVLLIQQKLLDGHSSSLNIMLQELMKETGNSALALEATQKVLSMTNNKRIDVNLLENIITEIERRNIDHVDSVVNNGVGGDLGLEKSRETARFTDLIGKIIQQIVAKSGGEIWGLFARWLKLKGHVTMCSEALLKQVRSYQGSELWKDKERFVKFAHASLELCKVYMEIGSRNGGRREFYAAEMHLKRRSNKQLRVFQKPKNLRTFRCFLRSCKQCYRLVWPREIHDKVILWDNLRDISKMFWHLFKDDVIGSFHMLLKPVSCLEISCCLLL